MAANRDAQRRRAHRRGRGSASCRGLTRCRQECKLKPEVWEKVREMRDEPILNVDPAVFEDEVEYGC